MVRYKIGLTGGIGSGKSEAGKCFAAQGCTVIDTDQIAREIVAPGRPALAELEAAFGGDILENGRLNRKKLAAIAFSSDAARQTLNAITHKYIKEETCRRLEAAEGIAVIEAPLLFEAGMDALCDLVVTVTVPLAARLARVMVRDGATREEALARIAAQKDEAEYCRRADRVLVNDGDRAALEAQIIKLMGEISS